MGDTKNTSLDDPKQKWEREVFLNFAETAPFHVVKETVKNCNPPHPDIKCEIEGEGEIYFELVEIVDEEVKKAVNSALELEEKYREAYKKLPSDDPLKAKKLIDNTSLRIGFKSEASVTKRKKTIPTIFEIFRHLPFKFEGDIDIRSHGWLSKVVGYINVRRGSGFGPIFSVNNFSSFSETPFEQVEQKFGKTYCSDLPIELLVYRNYQHNISNDEFKNGLFKRISRKQEGSRFRRCWYFDNPQKKIIFSYPDKK